MYNNNTSHVINVNIPTLEMEAQLDQAWPKIRWWSNNHCLTVPGVPIKRGILLNLQALQRLGYNGYDDLNKVTLHQIFCSDAVILSFAVKGKKYNISWEYGSRRVWKLFSDSKMYHTKIDWKDFYIEEIVRIIRKVLKEESLKSGGKEWGSFAEALLDIPQEPQEEQNESEINPSHYKKNGIEAIDVIEAFLEGNHNQSTACAYIIRAKQKGEYKTDLKKTMWYLERELSTLEVTESTEN